MSTKNSNCHVNFPTHGVSSALNNIPILRFLKDPAKSVQELYIRFRNGTEAGSFAFVEEKRCFYYWNYFSREWLPVGNTGNVMILKPAVNTVGQLTEKYPDAGMGWACIVLSEVDEQGEPYLYQFDGEVWGNTGLTLSALNSVYWAGEEW